MRSYSFIESLFTGVLAKSKSIAGRFFITPKFGVEINTDDLGSVMEDVVKALPVKKYPLAIMMPPRSSGNYTDKNGEWEHYKIVMFFLTSTYYDSANQVKALNPNTQTSMQPVKKEWEDMKVAAVDFLRVLGKIERSKGLVNSSFRLGPATRVIDPVSNVGVDRASGVRLDFFVSLFLGCVIEDYTDQGISEIVIPA